METNLAFVNCSHIAATAGSLGCSLKSPVNIFGKELERDSRSEEVLIQEAVSTAAQADVVIAAVGEVAEMSGECSSRSDITLPSVQRNLLNALLKTGKPVVMVLFTGRPLALKWEAEHMSTILNVWHPGTEAGNAIADVLFGKENPSGKLSASWPQNVGQVPIFYNHKNTGRPLTEGKWFEKFKSNYLDVTNDPLFSFGYGLSYTQFQYGKVQLSKAKMTNKDSIEVKVNVTNTGNYDGAEVVQLYIRDVEGSTTRPVKELKGFKKIFLKKGASQDVVFTINVNDLKYYDNQLNYIAEPGTFTVFVGTNSETKNSTSFELIQR